MRSSRFREPSKKSEHFCAGGVLPLLLLCLFSASCGDSCFTFISNPGGTVSGSDLNCPINTMKGMVAVRFGSAASQSADSASPDSSLNIRHIFVAISGIQVHPTASIGQDSPAWLDLAPALFQHPVQVDLLAAPAEEHPIATQAVPSGTYDRVRLQLLPSAPPASDALLEENACGNSALNCVVMSGGRILPINFENGSPEFQIPSAQIAGGFLSVLPDTTTSLLVDFDPSSSRVLPIGAAAQLLPLFTAASAR
jgi:hypothetical protein